MAERHRYCVITADNMVLTNIQLNNKALSIHEMEDYSGEEGLWILDNDHLLYTAHCNRCGWRTHNRHAKYCEMCGSRNRFESEVE